MRRNGEPGRWTRRAIAKALAGAIVFAPAISRGGGTASPPLPRLPVLPESEALLLTPSDPRYAGYAPASNKRTMLQPALRAVCRTPRSVATLIDWVRANDLPFALRSGGHSYEGFSESAGVVIDTREIADIEVDAATDRIKVGAGLSLGAIYRFLAPRGLVLPAGSCPTVGIAGHTLGGGYGLLARPFGLSADSLLSIDLVDPQAHSVSAGPSDRPDLFWACRGGGGGSFGAVTHFAFQAIRRRTLVVFGVSWELPADRAARLFKAWQAWSPNAPQEITASLKIMSRSRKLVALRCFGQSTGTAGQLGRELAALTQVEKPTRPPGIAEVPFLRAVDRFSGGAEYPSSYFKGKSDLIVRPLGDDAIATLLAGLQALPAGTITAICDPYGGAIARVAADQTAFAHRDALYCIQYYSSWESEKTSPQRLDQMNVLYASIRPFVSGGAYVNYCDLDLTDWPTAYWGANLARLSAIKARFDPADLFRHAQSVPLPGAP